MSGGAYPLARLADLRAMRAAGAAFDLADALRGEAAAEEAVTAAARELDAARAAAHAAVLIPGGQSPAWQVAQHAAWAARLRRDVARAEGRLAERRAELAEWAAAVAQAHEQATSARAEHQVVERHRERWQEVEKKKRERRED